MSRWNETYQTHQYRSIWESLKEKVREQQVDDRSVETNVVELDRLKKVIEYLDDLIESIDPELVPLSIWEQFMGQAQPCLTHVTNFEGNRNISHIQQANGHADNLLTYIRPYMVLPKDAAASLKRAATVQVKATEKEMAELINDAKGRLADIAAAHQKVGEIRESSEDDVAHFEKLRVELLGDDGNAGLSGRVSQFASDIKSMHEELSKLRSEALGATPDDKSLKSEIVAATEFARSARKDLTREAEELTQEMEQIREFHTRAFGTEPDTGEHVPGMEDELKGLLTSLQDFERHQATRYKALTEQIEDLLPGATSAGLASAYTTLRNSFDDQIRTMTTVFYVCIAALIGVALYSSVETLWSPTKGFWVLRTYTDWEMTLRGVVSRLPIYGPAVWLAYFASKRRSEAQRLQQEYAHKEAVAKSYISYKKQLDELEEEGAELRRHLLSSTIETIARNASTTLDGRHGDKSPVHEALEALGKTAKDQDLKAAVIKWLERAPGQN